jgi:hypothetical protein
VPFTPGVAGSLLDVRDEFGTWWLAQVLEARRGASAGASPSSSSSSSSSSPAPHGVASVRVHYVGWADEFDEWVPVHDRAAPAFSHSSLAASRCGACGFKLGGAGSPASDGAQLVFCEAASCGKAHHLACVGLAPPAPRAWRCTLHRGGLQGGAPKKMRPA